MTPDSLKSLRNDYLEGEGHSYGLDLLFRKDVRQLRGWTTLSLLKAERTFPHPLAQGCDDVAPTITYPPAFDRRVDFDIVLEYPLPRGIEAGLRWNFGSGIPYSRPDGQHVEWEYDGISGRYEIPEDDDGERDRTARVLRRVPFGYQSGSIKGR